MGQYDRNPRLARQMKKAQMMEKYEAQREMLSVSEDQGSPYAVQTAVEVVRPPGAIRNRMGNKRFGRGTAVRNPHKRSTVDVSKSFEDIHKMNEKALRLLAKQ